nr:immunoglobulin heavy chain junction region [Mus musculus]
CARGAMDFW